MEYLYCISDILADSSHMTHTTGLVNSLLKYFRI